MARYIDAVELIKAIEENQRNTEHHKDGRGKQIHVSEHRHFIKMVYEQPTADVVQKSEAAMETIDDFLNAMRQKHEEQRRVYGGALALLLPDIEQIATELKKKYTEEYENDR